MASENFRSTLAANLSSLERASASLAERLSSVRHEKLWDRLIPAKITGYTCKVAIDGRTRHVNSTYDPWTEADKQLLSTLDSRRINDLSTAYYFGVGLGYHLKLLLETLGDRIRVVLYEQDPDWLIMAFSLHDFTAEIESSRLRLCLDMVTADPEPIRLSFNDISWAHPVLWDRYSSYYNRLIRESFTACEPGGKMTVLTVIIYPYSAYLNLSEAVSERFRTLGFDVVKRPNIPGEIRSAVLESRPALIFSMSFSSSLANLSSELEITYVCWELDKVMNQDYIPYGRYPYSKVFTTYLGDVARFDKAGHEAFYLPAAPDMLLEDDFDLTEDELNKYSCDISFVGSPLLSINNDYLALLSSIKGAMDRYGLAEEGRRLIGAMEKSIARQKEFSLINRYELPGLLREEIEKAGVTELFTFSIERLGNIIAKQCCGIQRLGYLMELAPTTVAVYGAGDWLDVKADHLLYRGMADFDRESGMIYRASKINLDITRIYQLDGFSDRVFNILWAGGFLMMNRTQTIERSFKTGKELVVFDTPEEMKQLCEHYLNEETERRDIARQGRARVRESHSVAHRVDEMLSRVPGIVVN